MATMVLFSEVQGVVLDQGQPVAGAQVRRDYHWHWKNQRDSTTTRTDDQGRFYFPAATGSSLLGSVLPHEPVIVQEIHIHHDGRDHEAWLYTKHNYDDKGELDGRPLNLTCRLETPPDYHGEVYGICTFE